MKKIAFRGRSGSIFAKVLYSYILIFTLPLIVFGMATYYWLTSAIEKETNNTYSGTVEDIRTEIDRNFQTLDKFAVQLSYMPWAVHLMNMEGSNLSYDRLDIGVLLNVLQELRIFQATYPFVDEMAIDFTGKDTIISTVGKDSRERFFSDLIRYKGLTADDWSNRLSEQNNRTLLPPEEASVLNQSKHLLTYMHTLPPGDSIYQATLLLFIKEETIQELLSKSALVKQNSTVYVTDRQGNFVTNYGGKPVIQAALEQQLNQGSSNTVRTMHTKDGTGYVHYRSSEGANGWTYHLIVPDNMLTAKLKSVRIIAIALMMFYLLIGVIASYMLARRDYRPVAQILSLVHRRLRPDDNASNEYSILENAIYDLLHDADRSESEILLYKPLARNTCLTKLLKHEDHAETVQTMELLDISFPHEYYRCIVLLLDEGQLIPESLPELLKLELNHRPVTIYWVELDGRSKALILNADNNDAEEEMIEILRERLQEASVAYRAIGVGRRYRSLDKLHLSYTESLRALEYRFIQADGSTLFAERFADANDWKGTIGEEDELKKAIRNGNATGAVEMASRVIRTELLAHRLSIGGIRFLCYRVATVALVALEEMNIAQSPSVSPNEVLQQDELDAMLTTIRKLFEEAAQLASEEQQSRNDHLIRKIQAYLEQHYTDQNLSLTSVADVFGISPSYLSRYFKNQTGTNFVDYVNRRRIEASKRWLTGEITVVQVAQKVGFDNDITFRRLFKKYLGITPSQYKGNE